MRVAFLLSGKPRFVKESYPYFKKNIIDPNNADVYCHFWKNAIDKNQIDWKGQKTTDDDQEKLIISLYNPKKYITEDQKQFSINDSSYSFDTGWPQPKWLWYSMFYGAEEGLNLIKNSGIQYDWIIRSRWDFWIDELLDLSQFDPNYYYTTNTTKKWWMLFDEIAIADVIGFSKPEMMYKTVGLCDKMVEYYKEHGVRWCQETFLGYHLHYQNVPIKLLRFNKVGLIRESNKAQSFHLHHQFII